MLPGRVFTMAGERYLYLEDMGNGNHMIIRHDSIRNTSQTDQPQVLSNWFSGLDAEVQAMVQPVSIPAVVPHVHWSFIESWEGGVRWIPAGWATNPLFDEVRADRTAVNSSGTPQAFALSMADVGHLSTETGPFPNHAQRVAANISWWWTRTPSWLIHWGGAIGELHGDFGGDHVSSPGGNRPAIIIHQ